MKSFSVKAYAELIGKSEKTVYKMIKSGSVDAYKYDGKFLIHVDPNLLKTLQRVQDECDELKRLLEQLHGINPDSETARAELQKIISC